MLPSPHEEAGMNAAEQARYFGNYAKCYHAGAFATPTRKELESGAVTTVEHPGGCLVAYTELTRDSNRKDFRGLPYTMPAGALVGTHVAHVGDIPSFANYDFVMAYIEDQDLTYYLQDEGFTHYATRVSAASEIIRVWHHGPEVKLPEYDHTVVSLMTDIEPPMALLEHDIGGLEGYADDVPLYSDGSWSALTIRGFYPDDPGRNAKPSEQDRKWKAANPTDLELPCVWTKLAADVPNIVDWVTSVHWWGQLERVRLLRMKRGHLARHTDILDRFGGTQDGQVVRFHIPIFTHQDIQIRNWTVDGSDIRQHLLEGQCYYLDTRLPHAVDNPTDVERIHLVVDVAATDNVRKHIEDGLSLA